MIGRGEGRFDIAKAQFLVVILAVVDELVLRIDLADRGCARLDRLLDIKHMRQHLPVNAHRLNRRPRLSLGCRNHGRHRFAAVGHLVGRQQRFVIDAEIEQAQQGVQIGRHITPGQHLDDAGHLLGLRGVDTADAGVVMRAAYAAHRLIPGAAAQISRNRLDDFVACRARIVVQQRTRRYQHSGRAVAALGGEMLHEGGLQRIQRSGRQTAGGAHRLAFDGFSQHQAG